MGVFIVAELSANHNKDLSLAKESLYAIKECKADAIKLQTYTPDSLTLDCKSEIFKIKGGTSWDNKYLYDLYKEAYMPLEWNEELFSLAKKINLCCFSSAFDMAGVDLLESLENPLYKIASFEITDIPLIKYIASKNKPIILSSGIAQLSELQEAIEAIRKVRRNADSTKSFDLKQDSKQNMNLEKNLESEYNQSGDKSRNLDSMSVDCQWDLASFPDITLLKCTSAYPANLSEANIAQMVALGKKFDVSYGLSDHTLGNRAAVIATSLKASVIEKHFILNKKFGGVDSSFSLDMNEFSALVRDIRETETALGESDFEIEIKNINLKDSENIKGRVFARSLFVSKNIKKGEKLSLENIKSIRPNAGLPPKMIDSILNKTASKDLIFGKPLEYGDFE